MQTMQEIRVVMYRIKVNLGAAVEMKLESNRNDQFKEWREVKIIGNEHICKNLVLQNLFLVSLWTYYSQCFSFAHII